LIGVNEPRRDRAIVDPRLAIRAVAGGSADID